jgi:hypothetical protein
VGPHPALLPQLGPDLLREDEVGGVVAVQVADLAPADREGELAARAGAGLHPRPGGDLLGDPLTRASWPGHACLLGCRQLWRGRYKLK